MNTDLPKQELELIGREHASICMERPRLFDLFTDWTPETSRRHLDSCERLLREFTDSGSSTMDDLFRLELSACYCAALEGDHVEAKRRMARVAALSLLGLRYLSIMYGNTGTPVQDDSNDSEENNEGTMELDSVASGAKEVP